jgi:hypothetical protein
MRFLPACAVAILSSLSMPVFGESNIMECKTQASMESNVQSVLECHKGEKVLVVFDVDMVLTQPSDPVVQMGALAAHRKNLGQLFRPLSDKEKQAVLTLAAISSDPQLVSQKMPEFVQSLNAMENVYTIGLTAFTTGPFQSIPSLEKWRIDVLKSFGIYLGHKDFPSEQVALSSGCNGVNSLFLEGIVFCDDVNNPQAKPDNLFAFLKRADWVPDVIIFIDDRDKYLHAMDKALSSHYPGIHFVGLHYKQALSFPENPVLLDDFQAKWEKFVVQGKKLAQAGLPL